MRGTCSYEELPDVDGDVDHYEFVFGVSIKVEGCIAGFVFSAPFLLCSLIPRG